ncbi:MAG: putative porin [Bacteroidaceae bacterium]|nr:putative porin [Bacteroidaceae bacterium]
MNPLRAKIAIPLLSVLFLSYPAQAQQLVSQNQDGFESNLYEGNLNALPERDSTVVQREVPKDYVRWKMDPYTGLKDTVGNDTVQYLFQNQHKTEGKLSTYNHLGNMGSPRISRLFSERDGRRRFVFDRPYSLFIKDPGDFLFTDTKTPHLNITYFNGGNKRTGEDHINGYFAANFGKLTGIGLNMDYLFGRGRYQNQGTSMFDTRVYAYYHGDNWSLHASFNTDQIKMEENGGITDDRYITSPEMMSEGRKQYQPEEIPVRLSRNWNNLKRKQALIVNTLSLNRHYEVTDSVGDTIMTSTFSKEFATVSNTTEFGILKRRFITYNSPNAYYQHEWLKNDSLDFFRNFYVSSTLSFNLNEGFSKWAVAGLNAYARYELRSYSMSDTLPDGKRTEFQKRNNEYDIFVGGSIQRVTGRNLKIKAFAETSVLGDRLGDFTLNGNLELHFNLMKQQAALEARAVFSGTTPDYFQRHFHSQHFWWDKSLKKELTSRIEGEIRIDRWRTRLVVGLNNLNNYTYYADNGVADVNGRILSDIAVMQEGAGIQVIDATLHQDFKLGPLHWDNSVTWQYTSNGSILPLPQLNAYSNLYLRFLYAKRLQIEFGGDVSWFSSYYAPDYSPALGQFHLQNSASMMKIGNYPFMDVYINCKLSGVRFYAMYSHVNQGMNIENGAPFLAPHYPVNPRMFKIGLSWTFFD